MSRLSNRVKKLESFEMTNEERFVVLIGPNGSDFSSLEKKVKYEHEGEDISFIHILLFGQDPSEEPKLLRTFRGE